MNWKQEVVYARRGRGQSIADITYTLWPSADFVSDIKAANVRLREGRNSLRIANSNHVSPFLEAPPAGQGALEKQDKK